MKTITATMLLVIALTPLKQLLAFGSIFLVIYFRAIKRPEIAAAFGVVTLLSLGLISSIYQKPINLFLSFALLFPFILTLFFKKSLLTNLLKIDINAALGIFIILLIVSGMIGLAQFAIYQNDDAAIGFYGRSGLQTHGLAILYFMATLYLIAKPYSKSNAVKIAFLLLFMITCFYGAGIVAAVIALALSAIAFSKSKRRSVLITISGLVLIGVFGWLLSPRTMIYNYNVLMTFFESIWNIISTGTADTFGMPRKLIVWISYFQLVVESPWSLVIGLGGGTFNSRTAFLLNGDYTSLAFLPISVSEIHRMYVMPLWSNYILSQAYSDGTMNQPFSSVLALIAEYGAIAFAFSLIGYNQLRRLLINQLDSLDRKCIFALNALFVFFGLLCIFDNILEYPEIVIPFIFFSIGIVSNVQLKSRKTVR